MAYTAVISLMTTIEDLENSPRISLSPPSLEILNFAYKELDLRKILKRLDESSTSNSRKKVNALDAQIKEAAWKFQDLLESHVHDQILPQSHVNLRFLEVQLQKPIIREVDHFIKMLKNKEKEYMYELDHLSPEEAVHVAVVSWPTDSGAKKFKMVGSSDSLLGRIRYRLKINIKLDFVLVFGMAGIGKTTITKEIFDDPLIFSEFKFECHAWVTIGRNYQLDKLIRDILIQLDPSMLMEGCEKNEGEYLIEFLKAKRCLIVLDDIWDTHVCDHFKSILPEYERYGHSGRTLVLLTTRLRHVGRYAEPSILAIIHTVELLNKDQNWDLLRQRVFGEEDSCPPQLYKAGKKIAEKCDGLPLMIVTVADLLGKADKTAEYWENVAENKNSSIFMAAYDQLSEVLFPSYEYLPQHLKPCFLHMGVFPQSYEISTSKLLSMWDAEGFLDPYTEETMEECSKRYLGELIDHSVVIKCQRSSTFTYQKDEIKTCRLHSTFWHLCNREATNSKFFNALTTCADCSKESVKGQRRLSMHNNILFGINGVFDSVEKACASTARSLLCYGPYYPYAVPISGNLRLLKVLDALQIRFYEFPIQVLQLLYLRYITLTYNGELPASISKLWNLRFLIIHRNMSIKYSGVTSYVPIELWDMEELKHIEVMGSNLPHPSSGASLERLLTLKGVGAETCTKEVLERIPNLRKLGIQIQLHPDDDMKAFDCLDHVHVLHQLSSLTCVVVNPMLRSQIVSLPSPLLEFPFTLSKLHLSGLGYPWEYMSIIGNLRGLAVLKLRCYAFRGPKWEVDNTVFKKLDYLLIEETDLKQLKVGFGGFRRLNRLCLKHCYKLKDLQWETPEEDGPEIEVIDCSPSTVTFANEMRSKYESCYNEPQNVYVQSSWDDGKLK